MNVSTGWIKDWLETGVDDKTLIAALEQAGIEVEDYQPPRHIDGLIVVALVEAVLPHPAADRLHLVDVTNGKEHIRVVCGAPNVRAGLRVALAQVGTVLPDGEKIAAAKLRGESSQGMLCSERELGLGTDHDGILELPETAQLGRPVRELYTADGVVELKTQANRFDLLSIVGLAREVAAIADVKLKPLPEPLVIEPGKAKLLADGADASRVSLVKLSFKATDVSPGWLVTRLQESGVRSINPIVDITNYVNFELGQPLHAYDAAKLKLPLTARKAKSGEKITTLDGTDRTLTAEDLVMADAHGPVALAGVMGGSATQVEAKTQEIILEAAVFDPPTVRKMAKRHGLRTDASARFERGLPVQLPAFGVARAIELLREVGEVKILEADDQLNVWPWVQRIGLRQSQLNRLLGFQLPIAKAVKLLGRIEIEARPFDIAAEARQFLGRPYKLGASFRTDGTAAFDCSYLTDYLYSLIGLTIGHTAHQQFKAGQPVELSELVPGDLVFCGGEFHHIDAKEREGVGHVALYIGHGTIIEASQARPGERKGTVHEAKLETITTRPDYLGARRFADNLDDFLTVPSVPWWRPDLHEGQDLVEEIVRVLGYAKVPATLPVWRPRDVVFDRRRSVRRRLQQVLYGAGLFEVMTYSFVSENQLETVRMEPAKHLKLQNPLSSEQAYLRSNLLPSHMHILAQNRKYSDAIGFYELSNVFVRRGKSEQPDEPLCLAVAMYQKHDSYRSLKGVFDVLVAELGLSKITVRPAKTLAAYAGARSAEVVLNGTVIGTLGEIDPMLTAGLKLEGELSYLELDANRLMEEAGVATYRPASKFPSAQRDLAVVINSALTWTEIAASLNNLQQTSIEFVSDYYGDDLPSGKKSLAFRLVVSHSDRTPTDSEVADAQRKAMSILAHRFGAEPRT